MSDGVTSNGAVSADDRRRAKGAARQQAWRARQQAAGLVPVTVLVPKDAEGDIRQLAARLVDDRELVVGPPRRRGSGWFARL